MGLTNEQQKALQDVVAAKIKLWDAAQKAESLLGFDIDMNIPELESLCSSMNTPEEAYDLSNESLLAAFSIDDDLNEEELMGDHVCDDDCRSFGCDVYLGR